jgi:hypothetical protein
MKRFWNVILKALFKSAQHQVLDDVVWCYYYSYSSIWRVPACVRSIWYGGACDVSGQEQDKKNEGGREEISLRYPTRSRFLY